jgi:predicted TIM-barrel fold metal-dependent hydrolase
MMQPMPPRQPTTPPADPRPHTDMPIDAAPTATDICDSHMHIYDLRFAHVGPDARVERDATVDDYRRVQTRLQSTRTVVVTPRNYATDNRITLDAIQRLGADRTRGVAVVRADVGEDELRLLHAGGIRGIRFTLYRPEFAVVDFTMLEPLARRISRYGWHVQLHWTADQVVAHRDMLERLAVPIVFDHLGRLPLPQGTRHPAFGIMRGLVERERAWVKLSGPYLDSQAGDAGGYADLDPIARSWIDAAPERLVWGSDWPHSPVAVKPDTGALFDLLARWAPDERVRQRILVDNPARLYEFPA